MFRRIFLISLFIIFVNNYVLSQEFDGGLLGGLSTSQVDGDTQKGFKKLGIYSGLYVGYNFNYLFSLKIEMFYIGKGAKKIINNIEEFKTRLHYVELPFMISIKPVDKFRINAGIAGAYLINSKLLEQGFEISKNSYDINRFDWGGIVTSEYYFSKKLAFNIRFEYSIAPMRTKPHRWFNSNLSFGLIYTIIDNSK